MTNQKTNPKIDWGYYATTPRIVRTHYKKLTHVEKWLYVCLKDLCGDTGTCYRTLRVLSEETDLSTGTLSTGIRHLQEAGLIHAEKKRRNNNPTAKEVWHITIVDIWQENGKVHPTAKCSGDEQKRSPDEHYGKNVQGMNNNVQEMNKEASKRSPDEQKRSNFDDRSNNTEAIPITEERTIEDESNSNIPDTHTFVSSDTARASFEIYGDIVPYTFVEALAYLAPHGGVPPGYGAIEVVKLAQKLYAEAHSQDEQVFTDEKPQGDDHATAVPGHSHRLDDAAARGDDTSHSAVDSGQVAAPEDRPVLETGQEIDNEGEHHATVPTVPATNPAAHSQPTPPRHAEGHSDSAALSDNDLPVVRPVGSGTTSSNGRQDTEPQGVAGRDAAQVAGEGQADGLKYDHTGDGNPLSNGHLHSQITQGQGRLAETPTTSMPAQSLSSPQAEQAALGTLLRTKAEKKTGKAEPVKPEFTPEGEALYQDWCSLFHVTIPKTKAIILAANELAEPITVWAEQKLGISSAEVLKRIMNWLYKNNANYYGEGRGVKLYDIHRDFEEWQSAAERKLAKDALKVVVSPAEDKSRIFSMEPIILPSRTHKGGLRGKAVATTH